eukprot:m.14376 g.14376  ORF g.14376 m.14376 type:complete len:531 (-) comp10107_c0_seq1:362-1954(-)
MMTRILHTLMALGGCVASASAGSKPNILMIASDDMRPEMSPYGMEYMATPNFQSLADDGFTFRRCYVQQALCAPSRTVLLTGRRPDTSRVWSIGPYFRNLTGKNWTSLPEFFKKNGYRAIGHGKIFHEGNASGWPLDQDQEYGAWSVPFFHPKGDGYDSYNKSHPNPFPGIGKYNAPYSNLGVDAPWQTFNDASSALHAINWIQNASKYTDPFFLAVGFHRPHIPYIYPKEFEFKGDVMFPPKDYYITKDIPPCAPHDWTGEGNGFTDLHNITPPIIDHNFQQNLSSLCTAVPLEKQAEMKRSYFSCIQYIDHLVGQLVTTLKQQQLYDNTHIIFWGDHGYKLGEHCDWFKHDNYEDSVRIPMILKPAHGFTGVGRFVEQMVEEVDIYPSLIDLIGLPIPPELQGKSWVPLLRSATAEGKAAVFSQYPHYSQAHKHAVMGYTMRTEEWRYTEWLFTNCSSSENCLSNASVTPQWQHVVGTELYDHQGNNFSSFGAYENVNLANQTQYASLVQQLHTQLVESWAKPNVVDV